MFWEEQHKDMTC